MYDYTRALLGRHTRSELEESKWPSAISEMETSKMAGCLQPGKHEDLAVVKVGGLEGHCRVTHASVCGKARVCIGRLKICTGSL